MPNSFQATCQFDNLVANGSRLRGAIFGRGRPIRREFRLNLCNKGTSRAVVAATEPGKPALVDESLGHFKERDFNVLSSRAGSWSREEDLHIALAPVCRVEGIRRRHPTMPLQVARRAGDPKPSAGSESGFAGIIEPNIQPWTPQVLDDVDVDPKPLVDQDGIDRAEIFRISWII
jgi:hypothetical protein